MGGGKYSTYTTYTTILTRNLFSNSKYLTKWTLDIYFRKVVLLKIIAAMN